MSRARQRGRGATFDLERFLPYRLSVVAERMSQLVSGTYAERYGLSVPEWRVISHLGYSTALSASAITQRTAMDKVKVSRALARLVERGLVRRQTNPQDQRGIMLSLTPAGLKLYEAIVPAALEVERAALTVLRPAEIEELRRKLERIAERLDQLLDEDTGLENASSSSSSIISKKVRISRRVSSIG